MATAFDYRIELWNGSTLSEILNPKINSCSWDYDRIGGCGECSIVVRADWDSYLTIVPGSTHLIKIKVRFEGDSSFSQVYLGQILSVHHFVDTIELVEFRAYGYSYQLGKTTIYLHPTTGEPASYSGTGISTILTALMDTYILPRTDIVSYSIAAVATAPESIIFDCTALNAIQLLSALAGNYEWGVNGVGVFYFKAKSTTVGFDINPGLDLINFEYAYDGSNISNRVFITYANDLEQILENESDVTSIPQATENTQLAFGMATTYQEACQTFLGLTFLKNIMFKLKKVGFSEIFTDGDMETVGTADWPDYGTGTVTKSKELYTVGGSDHYLDVNPTGTVSGVYQQISLNGEYTISFKYRVKYSTYPMKLQIYNSSDSVEIFSKDDYKSKSWTTESVTFSVAGPKNVDFRFIGGNFNLDDISGFVAQDDVEFWLTTAADKTTALKKVILRGKDITSTKTNTRIDFLYDDLAVLTSYAIVIKRTGALSDTAYYELSYANAGNLYAQGALFYYDGTWHEISNADATFNIEYGLSQQTYGVRSERLKIPSISDIADARLYVNSYLASKNYPIRSGSLSIITKTYFFDEDPCISGLAMPLLSVRSASDTVATKLQFQINKVHYQLDSRGLLITLDLGERIPRIADYLQYLEWQIDQLRQG